MTKISFVYFDVGGVLVQDFSDSPKWQNMMKEMGIPTSRYREFDEYYHQLDTEFCLGKHEDTALPAFIKKFSLTLPPNFSMRKYFIDHFFANSKTIWPLVVKLKTTHKIGLLTDMYLGMLDDIFSRKLIPPKSTWDVIIDSTEVRSRKPMPEIYQIAAERAGVPAGEILFIDNREKNLAPAAKLGWQTFLYHSSDYEQSTHDLATYLQLPGL